MNGARAWLLLCTLHGAASVLLWWWPGAAPGLVWRADQGVAQALTAWTSAWVHLSTPHLVGNVLALGALAFAGRVLNPPMAATAAWLAAWPLGQLALLLWPSIGYACGLSGLLHAGVAVLALHILLGRAPRDQRPWGVMLLGGLLIKLGLEQAWAQPVVQDRSGGVPVVQAAHLAGAAWGLLLGALSARRSRRAGGSGR